MWDPERRATRWWKDRLGTEGVLDQGGTQPQRGSPGSWSRSGGSFLFLSRHLASLGESSVVVLKLFLMQFPGCSSSAQRFDAEWTRAGGPSNGLWNSRMLPIIEKHLDANCF